MKDRNNLKGQIETLEKNNIKTETGGHKQETILSADIIVISPGVPLSIPVLEKAKERNIQIISEIEIGFLFSKAPIIAITGTKGKTTTTTLVAEILKNDGRDVILAGNIGIPITSKIENATKDSIVVTEISSFQLETIELFKPYISAVLNISADHMDRYPNIQEYVEAKTMILQNQDSNDFTVLNLNNKYSPIMASIAKSNVIYFSVNEKVERGVYLKGKKITSNINGREQELFDVAELFVKGVHNIENAMASVAMAEVMKVSPRSIVETLKNFRGVEHRQEYVIEINGITFINNSQGTNMDAVAKSILSYDGPVVLIMGGRSKGANFEELKDVVKQKVKALVLIGEAKEEIENALNGSTEIYKENTMEGAVKKAYSLASSGSYVMLSPGCTSFDMFSNYEERGRKFKEAVFNLKK
jgi:UDP-N-acetylmuramoylalanine--D-glutamate ligase